MANYDSGQASNVKSSIDDLKEPLEGYITMYNEAFDALSSLHPETQKQSIDDNKIDLSFVIDDYGILTTHFASSMEDMTEEDVIKSRDPANGFNQIDGTAEGETQDEESATADDVVTDKEGAAEGSEQEEQAAEADDIVEEVEGEAQGTVQTEQAAAEGTVQAEQVTAEESPASEEEQNLEETWENLLGIDFGKAKEGLAGLEAKLGETKAAVEARKAARGPLPTTSTNYDETPPEVGDTVYYNKGKWNVNDAREDLDHDRSCALVSRGDSLKIIEQQEDGRYLVETVNTIRPGEHFLVKPEEITSNPILGVGNEVFNLGDKATSKIGKVFGKIGRKVEKGLNFLRASQEAKGNSEKPANTETPSETPTEAPKATPTPTPTETPTTTPTSPETDTKPEDLNTVTVATKGGNLNFRTGAGTNNSIKGSLKQGTELQVVEDDKNSAWVKVRTSDGEEGYVYRKYVSYEKANPIETLNDTGIKQKFSEGQTVSVHTKGSRLNIRSGAGTNNSVIGSIENAADIKVLDDDGKSNWVHIVTSDGKEGYVYRDYLEDLNK